MTATPPASWISAIACAAFGPAARHEGFGAGDQVLLEEGPEVAGRAGRLGDVGTADRVGAARLADRVLEGQVEAELAQVLDDLPGPVAPFPLGPLAGRLDLLQVDPVTADMQVFRVLVHARHLHRRNDLDPELPPRLQRVRNPRHRVVVGERQGRDPGLRCFRDHLSRPAAAHRSGWSDSEARSRSSAQPNHASLEGAGGPSRDTHASAASGPERVHPTPHCKPK